LAQLALIGIAERALARIGAEQLRLQAGLDRAPAPPPVGRRRHVGGGRDVERSAGVERERGRAPALQDRRAGRPAAGPALGAPADAGRAARGERGPLGVPPRETAARWAVARSGVRTRSRGSKLAGLSSAPGAKVAPPSSLTSPPPQPSANTASARASQGVAPT